MLKMIGSVVRDNRVLILKACRSPFGTSSTVFCLAFLISFHTGCVATFSTENPLDEDDEERSSEAEEDGDTGEEQETSEETESELFLDTASEDLTDTDSESALASDEDTETVAAIDSDLCPDDPEKTEPGECGCGVAEGACPVECPTAMGQLDSGRNLCWEHPRSTDTFTWDQAVQYCDTLSLGGHVDWRLPSRQNYLDLLGNCDGEVLSGNSGYCNPCAASDACNALFSSELAWHWTGTEYDFDSRWRVNFETGKVGKVRGEFTMSIRCVRDLE
jgi:hypothetical protein